MSTEPNLHGFDSKCSASAAEGRWQRSSRNRSNRGVCVGVIQSVVEAHTGLVTQQLFRQWGANGGSFALHAEVYVSRQQQGNLWIVSMLHKHH